MKLLFLDMNRIKDREALHEELQAKLRLPDYYGKNLDALNDVLAEGNVRAVMVFENCSLASDEMKDYLVKFRTMADKLSSENKDLVFRFFK